MDPSHLAPNLNRTPSHHRRNSSSLLGQEQLKASSLNLNMNHNNTENRKPRKLVLCFDGTGNKFHGDDSDSNILKIFRCLDRTANDQYHYYQPGIGTYVVSNSLGRKSLSARIKSWYLKAKDSAVGSSFDHHVVGGYRFLMRFYSPGDEIYFFGFSRGAYVARFLAEMLDYVGLLSHGNEEMVVFAWKAFSQWQRRRADDSEEGLARRREMYRFMKGFRETFSRPVKRIRFLGLFDTVNSVPHFETAWMQRSKFPYTARSSAKVIRHCVSIDERRAKFRQDLIYQARADKEHKQHGHVHNKIHAMSERYRGRKSAMSGAAADIETRGRKETLSPEVYRSHSRSRSRTTAGSKGGGVEQASLHNDQEEYESDSDDEQDIDEVWFSGGHGDVGGGWEIEEGTKSASHIPLVYMIREAQRAGLLFDPDKVAEMGCSASLEDATAEQNGDDRPGTGVSGIQINVSSPSPGPGTPAIPDTKWSHFHSPTADSAEKEKDSEKTNHHHPFHQMLHKAHTARIHDSLEYASGLGGMQVFSWKIMEYMPFRRMDLQPDGSWKPIRWPLPRGEVRDIPHTARIHGSVIRRMQQDENYRPGNLIVGGGGRGMRRAPAEHGIGKWEVVCEPGDPVGEVWVKSIPSPHEAS